MDVDDVCKWQVLFYKIFKSLRLKEESSNNICGSVQVYKRKGVICVTAQFEYCHLKGKSYFNLKHCI